MVYRKKEQNTEGKIGTYIYLTDDAKEQLSILSRNLVLSRSELIELLIRKTYTAHVELTNINYIETREEILKKIITDICLMKGEIEELKLREGGFLDKNSKT